MSAMGRSVVCIVTPGTSAANNGNWRTAARWAAMLRGHCQVIVQSAWDGRPVDALVALHARRSADSIRRYRESTGRASLAVMLTGTDLYRDLPRDPDAAASLDAADRIVALQDDALTLLSPAWRRKALVIFQSAPTLAAARKPRGQLRAIVVGHLREEKDPATVFAAVERLPRGAPVTVRHVGSPLDRALAAEARALARREPRYRYTGGLGHGLTRAAIKASHVLLHPSIMEGGANVVVEAVTSGTPVIASRISGNLGMLGRDYPGYFEPRDASALAACLVRCLEEPAYLRELGRACAARRALFSPAAEARAVRQLVRGLLA